ncbi:MAG: NADH:ubiquinone reductase (Na(+)-transporting) subunit C, partial [Bacteroidota bacterium]
MRQSNAYIIIYSAVLTIACGGILAFASISLKDAQDANIALEQKKNILSTVMPLKDEDNVTDIYQRRVKGIVIDFNGNVKQGIKPEQVVVAAEYKKAPQDRILPVYEFRSEADT